MDTCIILIDGSNFYYKLKDLKFHNLLKFDFTKFNKLIAGERSTVVNATYYVGKVRTDGTKKNSKAI